MILNHDYKKIICIPENNFKKRFLLGKWKLHLQARELYAFLLQYILRVLYECFFNDLKQSPTLNSCGFYTLLHTL